MTTLDPHIDMNLDDQLRCGFAAWRARHFGMDALGDPSFVGSQMRGRSVRLRTLDRVRAWMASPTRGKMSSGPFAPGWQVMTDMNGPFRRDDDTRPIHRTRSRMPGPGPNFRTRKERCA